MAKKTSDEYLASILDLLDGVIKENKKAAKNAGLSNVPSSTGIIQADAKNIEVLGNSLKVLSTAIPPLAKIGKDKYETVANGIKILGAAIKSFKIDKETLQAVGNAINAFAQIHGIIMNMSDNFIKSILSLNPIKAWFLGRRLGKFYGILAKGMLKGFLVQIVDAINVIPPNSKVQNKTFLKRLTNLGLIMAAILQIKQKDIMQLWFMGKMLGPKIGAAIGGFFQSLIDKLAGGPSGAAKAQAAAKVALSVSTMIGTLTLSLVALVLLFKLNKWQDLVGGSAMLLGIVALSLGIIQVLGSKKFKREANQAIVGAKQIMMLIGGLTLTLSLLILIAKTFDAKSIAIGAGLLIGIVALSFGIMYVLGSKKFKTTGKNGLEGVGMVILLFLGMSLAMLINISVGKHAKEIAIGGAITVAFTLLSILLFKLLSKGLTKPTVINGLIGVAGIVLMITGVSLAMMLYAKFLKQMDGISLKGVLKGAAVTAAMIVGMIGLAHILSPLALDPLFWAGFAMVETISFMITSISGALLLFTKLLKDVKSMSEADIKSALSRIIEDGGMIDCLRTIIDKLDDFGIKSAIKVAAIGKSIRPVIESISKFVDVVQKMASMKIADKWDKNGNPIHYIKLKPSDFKKAAVTLSESFSIFLTELGKGFDKIDKKARKNMKKLSGPLNKIITGVCNLIDPIMQLAAGKVQIGDKAYDVNIEKMSDASRGVANMITAMFDPLIELAEKDIKHKKIRKIFKTFRKSMEHLFKVFKYADKFKVQMDDSLIKKLDLLTQGGSKIVEFLNKDFNGIDKNARLFKIGLRRFKKSMKHLLSVFEFDKKSLLNENFPTQVGAVLNGLQQIADFLHPETKKFFRTVNINSMRFRNAMRFFKNGVKELLQEGFDITKFGSSFKDDVANLVDGLSEITKFITLTSFDNALHNSQHFEQTMHHTARGLGHIKPYLATTPNQIRDLAHALKMLDVELIDKEQKRTEAIQSISSNFRDMSDNIEKLNNTLNNSLRLANKYNAMRSVSDIIKSKGAAAIVEATEKVKDTVQKVVTNTETMATNEEKQKLKEEKHKENMQEFSQYIANAIASALNDWSNQNKEITVKFDSSPRALFGSVEMG